MVELDLNFLVAIVTMCTTETPLPPLVDCCCYLELSMRPGVQESFLGVPDWPSVFSHCCILGPQGSLCAVASYPAVDYCCLLLGLKFMVGRGWVGTLPSTWASVLGRLCMAEPEEGGFSFLSVPALLIINYFFFKFAWLILIITCSLNMLLLTFFICLNINVIYHITIYAFFGGLFL